MLVGRSAECARLNEVLRAAREGRTAGLLIAGEAGVGKSALLKFADDHAAGMTVLRTRADESESALAFLGLLDLCRPLLGRLDALPQPQAAALRSAFALGPAVPFERFAIAAATLGILSTAAADGPLLVLVDDAQWMDVESWTALTFAARRLVADPIALVIGTRDNDQSQAARGIGFERLSLQGLDTDAATSLLVARTARKPTPEVIHRLVSETGGNPLALIELAGLLTSDQLTGRVVLDDPLPAQAWAEQAFLARLEDLDDSSRRALLVAAAAGNAAYTLVVQVCAALGINQDAIEAAEAVGLVAIVDTRIQFCHPLARSVVYAAAAPVQRRVVHRALADRLADDPLSEDRRAWHLARSASGTDEQVAAILEQAAVAAIDRSGYAAAATALERSAALSPQPTQRTRRMVAAADAARRGGHNGHAMRLLGLALSGQPDALHRAEIQHRRGRIDLFSGRVNDAHKLLAAEAIPVQLTNPDLAAAMLAEAALAAVLAGAAQAAVTCAIQAQAASSTPDRPTQLITQLVLGTAMFGIGEAATGYQLLGAAASIAEDNHEIEAEYATFAAHALIWVGEYARAGVLLQRLTEKARAAGALGVLAHELYVLSDLEFRTGRWGSSAANATEAANMARDTGNAFSLHYALGILALIAAAKGRAADCRMYVAEALDVAQRMDIDHRYISDAIGLLELGLGHPEEAIRHLEPANRVAPEDSKPASALVVRPSVPDLFEAYVRAARPLPTQLQNALAAAEQLEFPVMRAAEKFCRALIADDVDYDDLYNDALRLHQEMHMPFAKARTALCYGERLRRDGRRVQARIQLRAAIQVFERLGATPWIDRAANELRATGETVRTRKAPAAEALTAQELQIAQIVARGATNRETAATLFLSPKTIEVHLGRVYRKLAVRSRTELSLAMQGGLEDTR